MIPIMTESYASVVLGGQDRNAEYLGIFVAWLVSNQLISEALNQRASKSVARLRLQDLTGSGFLTTVLNGELKPEHLSDEGNRFVESYFVPGRYRADYDGVEVDEENEWVHYDAVAPKISAAWREHRKPAKKPILGKILQFPSRR